MRREGESRKKPTVRVPAASELSTRYARPDQSLKLLETRRRYKSRPNDALLND